MNGPLRQLQPNRVRRHLTTGKRGDPGAAAHRHGGSRRHDRALAATYATIEPIRDVLLQMFMGEEFGPDPTWEGHLATEIGQAEVAVDPVLYEAQMPLRQMMAPRRRRHADARTQVRRPRDRALRRGHAHEGRIGRFGRVGVAKPLRKPGMTLAMFESAGGSDTRMEEL
jgi:flagellar motor switch protein FliM